MKLKDLKTIADELNNLFDLDPPIDTEEGEDFTVEMTVEALELVEKKDKPSDFKSYALIEEFVGEYTDQLSKKAIKALEFIAITPPTDVEDKDVVRDDDPVPDNLVDQIEEAETLKELKSIAKDLDEFKDIRGQLTKYKTKEDLHTAMLEHLEGEEPPKEIEPEPEPETEPTPKKSTKTKAKQPEKKKEPKPKPSSKEGKPVTKTETLEKSSVVKGMVVGSKIKFTPAPNSKKVAKGKTLTGKVQLIKISKRMDQEIVRIDTSVGIFHKASKSVELV